LGRKEKKKNKSRNRKGRRELIFVLEIFVLLGKRIMGSNAILSLPYVSLGFFAFSQGG
jgi:hypothetical protein